MIDINDFSNLLNGEIFKYKRIRVQLNQKILIIFFDTNKKYHNKCAGLFMYIIDTTFTQLQFFF